MRYVLLSHIPRALFIKEAPHMISIYNRHDHFSRISCVTALTTLFLLPRFLIVPEKIITLTCILTGLIFLLSENRRKKHLLTLTENLMPAILKDQNPQNTFFQCGEEVSRRFNLLSFVDFCGRLDVFQKRGFLILFVGVGFLYPSAGWQSWFLFFCFVTLWPLLFLTPGTMRFFLRIPQS